MRLQNTLAVTRYFLFGLTALVIAFSVSTVKGAGLIVTNTSDSGAGSLRNAVLTANSNAEADIITFDPATFGSQQTITLTTGEIEIDVDGANPGRPLTIIGPGRDLLTISGDGSSRIFYVDFNSTASISGMTLTNGNGTGTTNNTVNGSGGAIYVNNCDSVTLTDILITANTASNLGGGLAGANVETFRMTNSAIVANAVNGVTGGPVGGGMYLNSGSELQSDTLLSNVEIRDNTSVASAGGAYVASQKLKISDSVFDNNSHVGTAGGGHGGLWLVSSNARVSDTSITNNSGQGSGGGLSVNPGATSGALVILERLTIAGNDAISAGDGGGIFRIGNPGKVVLRDSLVAGNSSVPDPLIPELGAGNGAGIFLSSGPFDIINTTITGNTTSGTSNGNGGGIYNNAADLRVINSTISGNVAEGQNLPANVWRGGGGISTNGGATTTVQNTIISGNTATLGPDVRGTYVSNGFNIVEDASDSGGFGSSGDQLGVDPLLDAAGLQHNGGPTMTIALQGSSTAINNGSNPLAVDENNNPLLFDQRSSCFNRYIGGIVDIGAFEFGAVQLSGRNAPFDFDGDCRSDVSVFRPGPGEWWYLRSSDNGNYAAQFGTGTDVITPADFTGDGKTDVAFFRPSSGEWFILRSEDNSFFAFPFGTNGDIPAPGDFDGDGKDDVAVFRPSIATWFYIRSSDQQVVTTQFGLNGDQPIVEDYDGDGKDDLAVFRPSAAEWYLNRSTDGFIGFQFGGAGDTTPAPADFTGDGKADIGFFKPSSGEWFVLRSEDSSFFAFPFGIGTDIPIPGDYDGDGTADPAVFRPSINSWFLQQTTDGFEQVQFGIANDIPVPSAYITP